LSICTWSSATTTRFLGWRSNVIILITHIVLLLIV
jgi:hypothetical protein